jgi:hypothetical protein
MHSSNSFRKHHQNRERKTKEIRRCIFSRRHTNSLTRFSQEEANGFHFFKTSVYKFHYYETASGFRIVLNSDAVTGDLRNELKQIYALMVDFVVKNPLFQPNDNIPTDGPFATNLATFLQSLPAFTS